MTGSPSAPPPRSPRRCSAAAKKLRVIGRAGIGVDNVDVPVATQRGIIVMNTPFGNSITTAEHAIAMMFAVARQIPAADASTQAGKWEKNRFMGVEITAKTLGIIGCGNIGSIVAERAIGLRMRVVAYDPYLSEERAMQLGVEKVDLDELFERADFITLHTPLTEKTRNIVDAAAIAKMKDGVRIINCARGGLVVEEDLAEAIKTGKVAGAGVDVFVKEPADRSPLFGLANVVCTPHLGASTTEAQENVAVQVAEQMADYLVNGAVSNALNMPSITAEEAPRLIPFVKLAENLGSFAGQLTETTILGATIEYAGDVADMNTRALTAALLAGLLRPMLNEVNMVNAPIVARDAAWRSTRSASQSRHRLYRPDRASPSASRCARSPASAYLQNTRSSVHPVGIIDMEAASSPAHALRHQRKPGLFGRPARCSTIAEGQRSARSLNRGRWRPPRRRRLFRSSRSATR